MLKWFRCWKLKKEKKGINIPPPIIRNISVWSILEYMQSLLDEANSTSYLRHDEIIEEYNSIRKMLDVLVGNDDEFCRLLFKFEERKKNEKN